MRLTPEEAMAQPQPTYSRYGAKSPQFDDVGIAKREWVLRNKWREFSLSDVGDMFHWYEANLSAAEMEIRELEQKIKDLSKPR